MFTEDPITYQTNNLYSINGEAVFKIFADADGRFTGNVELPKATERYISSHKVGEPPCMWKQMWKWQSGGRYDRK